MSATACASISGDYLLLPLRLQPPLPPVVARCPVDGDDGRLHARPMGRSSPSSPSWTTIKIDDTLAATAFQNSPTAAKRSSSSPPPSLDRSASRCRVRRAHERRPTLVSLSITLRRVQSASNDRHAARRTAMTQTITTTTWRMVAIVGRRRRRPTRQKIVAGRPIGIPSASPTRRRPPTCERVRDGGGGDDQSAKIMRPKSWRAS